MSSRLRTPTHRFRLILQQIKLNITLPGQFVYHLIVRQRLLTHFHTTTTTTTTTTTSNNNNNNDDDDNNNNNNNNN